MNEKLLLGVIFGLAAFFKDLANYRASKIKDPTATYDFPLMMSKVCAAFTGGYGIGEAAMTVGSQL